MRVVAILETMWDWRSMTSGAGRREAPRYFRVNSQNHSGRRLYKLVGPEADLLVTNACRELVSHARKHGKPDPVWLGENLLILDGAGTVLWQRQFGMNSQIDVLLVCGKIAQRTYKECDYQPRGARVIEIPHPAARGCWSREAIAEVAGRIQNNHGAHAVTANNEN